MNAKWGRFAMTNLINPPQRRHPRESGGPADRNVRPVDALDSRLRGNDGQDVGALDSRLRGNDGSDACAGNPGLSQRPANREIGVPRQDGGCQSFLPPLGKGRAGVGFPVLLFECGGHATAFAFAEAMLPPPGNGPGEEKRRHGRTHSKDAGQATSPVAASSLRGGLQPDAAISCMPSVRVTGDCFALLAMTTVVWAGASGRHCHD